MCLRTASRLGFNWPHLGQASNWRSRTVDGGGEEEARLLLVLAQVMDGGDAENCERGEEDGPT